MAKRNLEDLSQQREHLHSSRFISFKHEQQCSEKRGTRFPRDALFVRRWWSHASPLTCKMRSQAFWALVEYQDVQNVDCQLDLLDFRLGRTENCAERLEDGSVAEQVVYQGPKHRRRAKSITTLREFVERSGDANKLNDFLQQPESIQAFLLVADQFLAANQSKKHSHR